MTTIKSYTDLEQSKKLADILPLESADYCWGVNYESRYLDFNSFPYTEPYNEYNNEDFIPCWSFAALLDVLPEGYSVELTKSFNGIDYCCNIDGKDISTYANNPIDACVELILKLHELNLL